MKVVFFIKFCPLCDKHVIAGALGKLMFNFTSICSDSGNFVKTLKILVKLIRNCPRAHAITYTNFIRSGSSRAIPTAKHDRVFAGPMFYNQLSKILLELANAQRRRSREFVVTNDRSVWFSRGQ